VTADARFMARALELAARAAGETNPNPMVGCVVVKAGRVVGEGFHRRAGGPHAEVFALREAGYRARGATLYVTLEPCSVAARTPACAPVVRDAGVRRVVAAMVDPNPKVDGQGLAQLRRAGVRVDVGVLGDEARRLNERFVTFMEKGRPYLLLKAALTLDGRIATARGESKWITSPEQRRHARAIRRRQDGVMVGIGTVLADDPLLLPEPAVARPFFRVVLDSDLRLPARSRLARTSLEAPVLVLTASADARRRGRLEDMGVRVFVGPRGGGGVSIRWALRALAREGLSSLMVEGGSEVLGEFLRLRLLDKVALYRAPLLLGGRGGRSAFGGPDPARLSQALRLVRAPDDTPGLCEYWYPEPAAATTRKTTKTQRTQRRTKKAK
jgi:diaminohydroxyphosphoribosylaminopyrimidine deaminase / 5-amino-6-(5-phosphoribosylamino)uracil reductase